MQPLITFSSKALRNKLINTSTFYHLRTRELKPKEMKIPRIDLISKKDACWKVELVILASSKECDEGD
jgi:hypothetical protein